MSLKQFVNKRKALVVLGSPLFWKVNELDLHTLQSSREAAFCRRCAKWCQLLGIWRLEPHFSLAELLSTTLETSSYWLSFSAASRATIRRCMMPDRTCKWRSLLSQKRAVAVFRECSIILYRISLLPAFDWLVLKSRWFCGPFLTFVWWG